MMKRIYLILDLFYNCLMGLNCQILFHTALKIFDIAKATPALVALSKIKFGQLRSISSYRTSLLIVIFSLLSFHFVWGQDASVVARLDSVNILIGAQTRLTLEATVLPTTRVFFPPVVDALENEAVEVVEELPLDTSIVEEGRIQLSKSYTVTSFDSGYHLIPPFPFLAQSENGQIDTLRTNPVPLNILLVAVDTTQAIKPIKEIEEVPLTFQEVLPWILGGLLVLAIIIGIIIFFLKRKKPEEPERIIPKEPTHVIALRMLDAIKNEKLWQAEDSKYYYSRLTEVIRAYIEHRFNIPALEQTSDEIFTSFKNRGLDREVPFENLQQMLRLADMVKFAKQKTGSKENYISLDQAYDFVQNTIRTVPAISEKQE